MGRNRKKVEETGIYGKHRRKNRKKLERNIKKQQKFGHNGKNLEERGRNRKNREETGSKKE